MISYQGAGSPAPQPGGRRVMVLSLVLALLAVAAVAWVDQQRIGLLHQSTETQLRAEARALGRLISEALDLQARTLALFVHNHREWVDQLVRNPEDQDLKDALLEQLRQVFPMAFAFTIADSSGNRLITDFSGVIGDTCQGEIVRFAALSVEKAAHAFSDIHPVPGHYHFDLMTRLPMPAGGKGVFLVSLPPLVISELLAAGEISSHTRMLVRADDPTLIDVTSDGSRELLQGRFRLPDDPQSLSVVVPVAGTNWLLRVDESAVTLRQRESGIRTQSILVLVAIMLLVVLVSRLAIRLEKQRQAAFHQQLREREAVLTAVYGTMVDGLIIIDAGGAILGTNKAVEQLFGFNESELTGKNVNVLMPEPYHSAHDGYLKHYLETNESRIIGIGREVSGRRKDGTEFPLALSVGQTEFAGQRIFVGIVHDISKSVSARQQIESQAKELERSNMDLEHFAYVASHDLQEPLRKVSSFGQLLELEYGDAVEGEGKDYIRYMTEATDRMSELLDGLLRYSRVSSRQKPYERVELEPLAREVLNDLSLQVSDGDVSLDTDLGGEVFADRTQMRQLVQNLVSNAIKFRSGERDSIVRISCREVALDGAPGVEIVVEDNGIGIDDTHLQEIFEPFRRLHTREAYPGTGLGLAIAKKIVERHRGVIDIDSRPGVGSRFQVTLPSGQQARP